MASTTELPSPHKHNICIAIHGGAGTITKANLSPEMEILYRKELETALNVGYNEMLKENGTSCDAVEAAVKYMEDCTLFNAGKGSVFNHEGKHELDASIMTGHDLKAGSVAGVCNIKNPITLARKVIENSEHVMLISKGAEEFGKLVGCDIVNDDYFYTEQRYQQWIKLKDSKQFKLDHNVHQEDVTEHNNASRKEEVNDSANNDDRNPTNNNTNDSINKNSTNKIACENKNESKPNGKDYSKFGTVGAVALDRYGNLCSGTSTGGMTNKFYGRVGDSPIIGAGTYANNHTCAVSCTGSGEYFIRNVVAYDVSCMIEYKKGITLKDAVNEIIHVKLKNIGGDGGLIAIDKNGEIVLDFNTEGMYRGWKNETGQEVEIYRK